MYFSPLLACCLLILAREVVMRRVRLEIEGEVPSGCSLDWLPTGVILLSPVALLSVLAILSVHRNVPLQTFRESLGLAPTPLQ